MSDGHNINHILCIFNSNRITRDGAKCLSEVLKQNPSLEILDLSSNRIEDDGAVYLSEAIKLSHSKLKAFVYFTYKTTLLNLKFTHETILCMCCPAYVIIFAF